MKFDKRKLADPVVVNAVKQGLASIPLPGRDIEQTSRTHIINESIREVLHEHAPAELQVPRTSWISDVTMAVIEYRNWIHLQVRAKGRDLKSLLDPNRVPKDHRGTPLGAAELSAAAEAARV